MISSGVYTLAFCVICMEATPLMQLITSHPENYQTVDAVEIIQAAPEQSFLRKTRSKTIHQPIFNEFYADEEGNYIDDMEDTDSDKKRSFSELSQEEQVMASTPRSHNTVGQGDHFMDLEDHAEDIDPYLENMKSLLHVQKE